MLCSVDDGCGPKIRVRERAEAEGACVCLDCEKEKASMFLVTEHGEKKQIQNAALFSWGCSLIVQGTHSIYTLDEERWMT